MTTHDLATLVSDLSPSDLRTLEVLLVAERDRRDRHAAVERARTYSLFPMSA